MKPQIATSYGGDGQFLNMIWYIINKSDFIHNTPTKTYILIKNCKITKMHFYPNFINREISIRKQNTDISKYYKNSSANLSIKHV